MKKIIKTIILIASFLLISKNVYAASVIIENETEDIKVHIKTNTIEETRSIQHIRDEETKEYLYNISLQEIDPFYGYDTYDYYYGMNTLEDKLKNKIALIVYYGYGYQDRTDIKWYNITQYLIWEEILKNENGQIYFKDTNNSKIKIYEKEIELIKEDIKNFESNPSFLESGELKNSYDLKLTDKLIFEDTNNKLKDFDIINDSNAIDYEVKNNKLIIKPIEPNIISIIFHRKTENLETMKIYINSLSHNLISRGKINTNNLVLTLNIKEPEVILKGMSLEPNKFPLTDNEYKIYSEEGIELYSNIRLNKEGISEKINLFPGKYYLEQTKTSYGYKLNQERIYFDINKEDITLDIKNELETKKVSIEYQLIKNNSDIALNSNIKLNIYDEANNFIKEITTDNNGKVSIDLIFGKYKIYKSTQNRDIKELANIDVNENFNENKAIIIKEELLENNSDNESNIKKGTIIINKIDYINNKPLSGIKYALYNKDRELIKEAITDLDGKIIFKDLETGIYYIKEILNDGDYKRDEEIKIEVKENIDTIITSNNRTEIDVPNTYSRNNSIYLLLYILIGSIYFKNAKFYKKKKHFS
jgi:hypothetical protein